MTKYHISKDGTPGICKAKHQCPLGGEDSHYDSYEKADEAAQAKSKEEFGVMSWSNNDDFLPSKKEIKRRESFFDKIKEIGYIRKMKAEQTMYAKRRSRIAEGITMSGYIDSISASFDNSTSEAEEAFNEMPSEEEKNKEIEDKYWRQRYERLRSSSTGRGFGNNEIEKEIKFMKKKREQLRKTLREEEINEDMSNMRDPKKWEERWSQFESDWNELERDTRSKYSIE